MKDSKPRNPQEIDTVEDRMGSMEPLDFHEHRDARKDRVGSEALPQDIEEGAFANEREEKPGLSAGGMSDSDVTLDDLSPETQIPDDGSRSPLERGSSAPADQELSIVSEHDIGADIGLDEAEQARQQPLDAKPWDGPADGGPDTGVSGGNAVLQGDESLLEEDQDVLSEDELAGDAPLDSGRDKPAGR